MKNNYLILLTILGVIFLRFSFDFVNKIDIHYEEAQYWVWSQNLSLSYLTKGPLLPWLLSFSNYLFGKTYFALKIFSFLSIFLTAALLSMTLNEISTKKKSNPVIFALVCSSPALFFLGGLATTDIFLFLFWSLALFAYSKFLKSKNDNWFFLIGFAVGLGLLIKASIILLPLSILLYFLMSDLRKYILSKKLLLSAVLANIIFLPVLIWNYQNDWLYFNHEIGHILSDEAEINPHVLLITMLLTVPSVILMLNKGFFRFLVSKEIKPIFLPMVIMTVFFLVKSIFGKVQVNWPIPIFLCLLPIVLAHLNSYRKFFAANAAVILLIFTVSNPTLISFVTNKDPLHPMRGWQNSIDNLFEDKEFDMLISNDYKLLSVASYYLDNAENLIYDRDPEYRMTHYDTWNNLVINEERILYLSYASKRINRADLNCIELSSINIDSRKNLILYTCKKL